MQEMWISHEILLTNSTSLTDDKERADIMTCFSILVITHRGFWSNN